MTFQHCHKRSPSPHDDRLIQVYPAAVGHDCRCQRTQALARHSVDPEYGYTPSGFDAFEMETGNDPVIGEPEGETRCS